ncbi:MAG: hypothetical protein M3Z66_13905 [Chloroflexota bacterium]|nr:hypothetical protein [Chloroflexota bacterium]
MRVLLLVLGVAVLSMGGALAQSPPGVPTAVMSPTAGDVSTVHQFQVSNLPANTPVTVVLFDPAGQQVVTPVQTDASGSIAVTLRPPTGNWTVGLYRAAVGLPSGMSVSATFAVTDGKPHLLAEPLLPSPESALNFVGVGFPPNRQVTLELHLTGGQVGVHDLPVTADTDGSFSTLAWPEQFGLPYFAAGNYLVEAPSQGLSTPFTLREHPGSASINVDGPVPEGVDPTLHFQYYRPGRYVWGVLADMQGNLAGQFLVGETDTAGNANLSLLVPILPSGQYLLATPYDWGEASFTVLAPTPTNTPAPPPTSTPLPVQVHHRHRHRHHHKRRHPRSNLQ